MKKIIVACMIAAMSLVGAGCGAVNGEEPPGQKKFTPAANTQIVETRSEDLDGDGKKEKIDLYVIASETKQDMPPTYIIELLTFARIPATISPPG